MSRSVLTSQINPHRIKEQWEKIIGDVDDVTIVEQSSEMCDAWKINECECVERLLFILKYITCETRIKYKIYEIDEICIYM